MSKAKGLTIWFVGALALVSASVTSAQNYRQSVSAGWLLRADAAQDIEKALAAKPNDLEARAQLITYYARNGQDAADAAARAARLRHVEWFIHNASDALLLRNAVALLRTSDFNSSNPSEPFRRAWQEQVDQHPNDPLVIENAWQNMGAIEAGINGGDRAAGYLRRLRVLEPGDPQWALDLAGLYALALPRGMAPNAPADAKQRADAVVAELQKSTDAAVVGLTGTLVYGSGRTLSTSSAATTPLMTLSASLLRRASTLNAKNPAWAQQISAPSSASGAAVGLALTELLQVSDLWPGGVVPAVPVPDGGTRLSSADEAARRPAFVLEGLPLNAATNCSVQFSAVIGADGRVKNLRVIGFEHLNIPFLAAERDGLRQVKYTPVVVGGRAVDAVTEIDAKCPTQATTTAPPVGAIGGIARAPSTSFSPPPPPPPPPAKIANPAPDPTADTRLVKKVSPIYPPAARQAGVQGAVQLAIVIGANGMVQDAKVVSGPPLLASAALDAVKQWVYRPYLVNGSPTPVTAVVRVNFQLAP